MTLQSPRTGVRPRSLTCDHPDCDAEYVGVLGWHVAEVRRQARSAGWYCQNPGPGWTAFDLCPDHWGVKPIEVNR